MALSNDIITAIQPVKVVQTIEELCDANQVLQKVYGSLYPNVYLKGNKSVQKDEVTLISYESGKKATATARVVFDSEEGLPDEALMFEPLKTLRKEGKQLAEVGRFAICQTDPQLLKKYYSAFYLLALEHQIDSLVFLVKRKDIEFHRKIIGTSILIEDVSESFGSEFGFCCCEWNIKSTSKRFFRWTGLPMGGIE